jgi:hypothetical protein
MSVEDTLVRIMPGRDAARLKRWFRFMEQVAQRVKRPMTESRHLPAAQEFTREELCTALAMACLRGAALAIAPSEIDAKEFDGTLANEVDKIRAEMAKRGIGGKRVQ